MSPLAFDAAEIAAAASTRRMRQWLAESDIDFVHLGLFDSSGTLREKRLSAPAAARAFENGWSFIDAIEWWGPADEVWREGGSEHQAAVVDFGSGRPFPFEPKAAFFLADFIGPLADLSPRVQLGRLVERAATSGLEAHMSWEFECIVLDAPLESDFSERELRPAMAHNRCWSAQTMASDADMLAGLAQILSDGNARLDHICPELGPGCLELAFEQRPAARAADDAALGKVFTKAYFARRGQAATFMAQLGPQFPGLGGHPSLSFRSALDGRPSLADQGGSLSKEALSAIAGVVALLPELLVMATPNPNSYRRFGPGNWAPSSASWGVGNYSCTLRVVADDPESTRLELRIPGADTNPHLCAAMFLGAALWGMEEGLDPPPALQAPGDGRTDLNARPLPRDLVMAVERFTQSSTARSLFGSSFVDHYTRSRLVEDEACRRFVSVDERARYQHQV